MLMGKWNLPFLLCGREHWPQDCDTGGLGIVPAADRAIILWPWELLLDVPTDGIGSAGCGDGVRPGNPWAWLSLGLSECPQRVILWGARAQARRRHSPHTRPIPVS